MGAKHDSNNTLEQPTTMNKNIQYITAALLIASAITGCKKDDDDPAPIPPPVNQEEVITTMILNFDNVGAGADKELRFTDADGDGGGAPVFDLDTLDDASVYTVSIILLNETVNPVDTVSIEVLEEAEDHQFFFQPNGANISSIYSDADGNFNPIGLLTTMTTGAPSVGTLLVTLRHEPNKTAAGVSSGDITNAGGDTDIEVSFPLVIE
jgi:hypothetical protein